MDATSVTTELSLSILAVLIAGLAALCSRWSAREARRANDSGRLNALLALRAHYQAQMHHQSAFIKQMRGVASAVEAASTKFADLDTKHREVSSEIDRYHFDLVSSK